tara:strand:+ start:7260 stop:8054 length:795 start_codon:yes stop_codon:yes gene_type:complete
MKKYLVIGNPIEHSLSPKLHNYWIEENNIDAIYEKKEVKSEEIKNIILDFKKKNINGINVTVPFKKDIISYIDVLSPEANATQSVNTIFSDKQGSIVGHNTDIEGFEMNMLNINYNPKGKRYFILGAGGVVSSIIFTLNKLGASEILVSNRTEQKAINLKKLFPNISIVDWGEIPSFDVIINATSLGLEKNDLIDLDFSKIENNKIFYDIIYNPKETNFLKTAKKLGNITENGKLMFVYQASAAFEIWHGVKPRINDEVIKLLD